MSVCHDSSYRRSLGLRVEISSLRAAGLSDLSPCVPPPNGLSRIFDDLGPLDGGHIFADSMLMAL
jgi:hypothetical protein